MTRNILVTGGAGYIGSVVVEQLVAQGRVPIVLDDLSTGHRGAVAPGVEFVEGNVGDRRVLDALFAGRSIDASRSGAADGASLGACINNNTFVAGSGFSAGIWVGDSSDVGSGNVMNGFSSDLTAGVCP